MRTKKTTKIQSKRLLEFYCFSLLAFVSISVSNCKESKKNTCDYHSIAVRLLSNIKDKNLNAIKGMMAFYDEGSKMETVQKAVRESLDSIDDLETLNYHVDFYKESPISYAVITILLRQRGAVRDFIEVRFSNPSLSFSCKIESFDFKRTGISPLINNRPTFDSANAPK
jgi:hypothetical protein